MIDGEIKSSHSIPPSRNGKRVVPRLKIEKLLFDISLRLMTIPFDLMDREIGHALRQIREFFQVDRCALLEFKDDKGFARITHVEYGEGVEHISGDINLSELFPWCYAQLMQGIPINICRVEDYPENALRDRQSHEAMGIKSALNIPLAFECQILRTIVINHTRRHQTWPEEYIPQLHLLGNIFLNALERRDDRLKLKEQLRFEMLLSEISAHFVNLPADRIDSGIEDAQHRICELLEIDRSTLWQVSDREPETMWLTHIHQPAGSLPPPERMNALDFFPWTVKKVLAGETVTILKMIDLPPEASRDLENFALFGTKSNVTVPLSVGDGPVFGLLTFAVMRKERHWPEAVVEGFNLVAQVFANALARKRADQALRESEERLSVATHAAGVGLWIMEVKTGRIWVSPITRKLFHFPPDEEILYESFFRVIHPQDRERVHQAVQRAQSGGEIHCDYRIMLPNGGIRWMAAHGQRHLGSTGEVDRLMGVALDITEGKRMEEQLQENLEKIEELKQRLERENVYLQEEIKLLVEHTDIVGQSTLLKKILVQAEQVARTDSTVLLLGETGTGKELLARAIHRMSLRKDRAMVTVNCAALPPTLIESELFGREKGAYTGALTRMAGRFELADGSTLFLDEIGELPLDLQGKLLRVLEQGSFERLGSTKPLHVNVRIIAASNRDIELDVKRGRFRQDLFYRLNVFPIMIPPLRERPEDIPLLVQAVVKEFQKKMGKEVESISKRNMQALQAYSWPGNVRELRNLIEHAMIVSRGKTLCVHVPKPASFEIRATGNLEEMERMHLEAVLEKTGWRLAGMGGAAEVLGLKRTTLISKMKKLGIKRSGKSLSN